jgi:general L-amino acid transport system permease protein
MRTQRLAELLTYQGIPLWRDVRVLRAVSQIVSAIIVVSLIAFFVSNLFLGTAAGFLLSETVLPYHESNSYLYAFGLGILNTLKVALVGIVLTTALGLVTGIARLSSNWQCEQLPGSILRPSEMYPY